MICADPKVAEKVSAGVDGGGMGWDVYGGVCGVRGWGMCAWVSTGYLGGGGVIGYGVDALGSVVAGGRELVP